eukprot:984290-Amphidinium_carterae.2
MKGLKSVNNSYARREAMHSLGEAEGTRIKDHTRRTERTTEWLRHLLVWLAMQCHLHALRVFNWHGGSFGGNAIFSVVLFF